MPACARHRQLDRVELSGQHDSHDAGARLARLLPHADLRHVFVLSDGLCLTAGLRSTLPHRVAVTGGLAADGSRFEQTLVTRAAQNTVSIEVSDTGVGIPEGMEARIFEPFVTTKPWGEGTGLGLAICRNVVESLGGQLTAERRHPRGATLRVLLPAADRSASPPNLTTVPARTSEGERVRILLIDDDVLVSTAIARVVQRHDPDVANTAVDALELLERNDYDLILCDLMMPELSGMEIFARTVARRPMLAHRFVFITAGCSRTARATSWPGRRTGSYRSLSMSQPSGAWSPRPCPGEREAAGLRRRVVRPSPA